MLVELRIRNVAVIDTVSLPLTAGLNVLTGETGAGKSIIIGALGMLLGERTAADRVRPGAERATVEGVFDISQRPAFRAVLDARGVEADDDLLVLKREVLAAGRSRAWINGSPVSASLLAEIGGQLVSVHGQHESRELVDADHQRNVLDAYAHAEDACARVASAYGELQALRARERELEQRRAEAAKRADYLRFVVREIEELHPVPGEDELLDGDIRRLSHAEELQGLAAQAAAAITGEERAALTRLAQVRRGLAALTRIDPDTERLQAGFDAAVYALEELARELESYAEGIDVDPSRLRSLERRREALIAVMRKHGPSLTEVLTTLEDAKRELELVDGGALDLTAIAEARAAAEGALAEAAAELTRRRRSHARQLGDEVSKLLPELGMAHGQVQVQVTPLEQITAAGAESVSFLARLNAGAEPRLLSRIASGGELSRVMLALSTVLAQLQSVPTLVFDEVDAGIGGAVAWQVGALMRRVATHHQVLAISHLAQIAARAQQHVVVRKSAVGTITTSDTTVVIDDDRVVEIARMLGGDAEREVSRAHARELLERGSAEDQAASGTRARGQREEGAPRAGAARRGKPV